MKDHILIVDDESKLRRVIRKYLEKEGYSVAEAENGEQALYAARQKTPALILLDIMMPVMNGFEFLRHFRKESEVPIIFLTAKDEEYDEILGLEIGADDYVKKPFSMRALMARVRAVLRRSEMPLDEMKDLSIGNIRLIPATREAFVSTRRLFLTPTEFAILAAMMSSPGRAFSRMELLERSSGHAFDAYERSIDVHIRNLRRKINEIESDSNYIETVFGLGYRFQISIIHGPGVK